MKVKKFNQLFEDFDDIREIEKFQQYISKSLEDFLNGDIDDIDISLKFGDKTLDIMITPENYDTIEKFVQELKENDDYFGKYKNMKKFNV